MPLGEELFDAEGRLEAEWPAMLAEVRQHLGGAEPLVEVAQRVLDARGWQITGYTERLAFAALDNDTLGPYAVR